MRDEHQDEFDSPGRPTDGRDLPAANRLGDRRTLPAGGPRPAGPAHLLGGERLDELLRRDLAPSEEVVDRVVGTALGVSDRAPLWRPAPALAAAALLVAALGLAVLRPDRSEGPPVLGSLVGEGAVVGVTAPGAGTWIVNRTDDPPPSGQLVVVFPGRNR